MAKIRAYKLAEELGIERNEFVEQAGTHGVELKNAMASLDEGQVELLREKLGGGTKAQWVSYSAPAWIQRRIRSRSAAASKAAGSRPRVPATASSHRCSGSSRVGRP